MDKKHLLEHFKIEKTDSNNIDEFKKYENNLSNKNRETMVEYIDYFKNSVYVGLFPSLKEKDSSYIYKSDFIKKIYWDINTECFCFDIKNQEELIPEKLKEKLHDILNKIGFFQLENEKSFIYKLTKNPIFNSLKIELEKELTLRNFTLDKLLKCIKERNPDFLFKRLCFYNKLIDIFECLKKKLNNNNFEKDIKDFIQYLKDKLILKKYLLIGNYKKSSTVEKPFILPLKFNFLIKDDKIRISTMGNLRINKKYIFFDDEYTDDIKFGIKYSILLNLYSPTIEKEKFSIDKWNNSLDFIINNFEFNNINDSLYEDIPVFEIEENFYHLYEAYSLALKTIEKKKDKSCLLNNLLIQKNIKSQETYKEQIDDLNNYDFKGYLKENYIYANNKIDPFGLNLNQKIFTSKVLNFFADNKQGSDVSNIIALNGPPGTGKTTVLQTIVASTIINSALEESENKSPPIIFGCSATNQAKNNIIGGFKSSNIKI